MALDPDKRQQRSERLADLLAHMPGGQVSWPSSSGVWWDGAWGELAAMVVIDAVTRLVPDVTVSQQAVRVLGGEGDFAAQELETVVGDIV